MHWRACFLMAKPKNGNRPVKGEPVNPRPVSGEPLLEKLAQQIEAASAKLKLDALKPLHFLLREQQDATKSRTSTDHLRKPGTHDSG
jgi:hypothetical protein